MISPPTVTSSATRCQAPRAQRMNPRVSPADPQSSESRKSPGGIPRNNHRNIQSCIPAAVAANNQVRRDLREIPAIAKRNISANHKHGPARAVDVTEIPAIVTPHTVPTVWAPMVWRTRLNVRGPPTRRTWRAIPWPAGLRSRRCWLDDRTPRLTRRRFTGLQYGLNRWTENATRNARAESRGRNHQRRATQRHTLHPQPRVRRTAQRASFLRELM
jgi:hypothetical protein